MILPIKPCPFCTSRDVVIDELGSRRLRFYAARCCDCESTGPIQQTYEAAVEAWNNRRSADPQ